MNDAPPLLHIRGVAKTFGAVRALRSADLEVRAGEAHALMGANGAGKSTLVKIITGVFPADEGEMTLAGQPVAFRSPAEARRAGIVSVYQDPAIVPDLTVAQNMRLARVSTDKVKAAMRDLGVERIDLKTVARDVDFALLRLIDLARALASDPRILMLDEITAALPADLSERVFKVVRDFRSRGASVIFISHRMAEIAMLCDRATVLRDGVTVGVTPTKGAEETIVNLMLGSDVARATTAAPVARAARPETAHEVPALEVKDLSYGHALQRRLLPGQSRRGARSRRPGRARDRRNCSIASPACGEPTPERCERKGACSSCGIPPTRSAPASCWFRPIGWSRFCPSAPCRRTWRWPRSADCALGGPLRWARRDAASTWLCGNCRSTPARPRK